MLTFALALTLAQDPQFIIVEPGHFHASLLQKEMYPGISNRVAVYSRPSPELDDYIKRVELFNTRKDKPTSWQLEVHRTTADPMPAMLRAAKPGNIAVFTGRNRGKIDRILAALDAGLHVLADKPWIIDAADMPKLEKALALAKTKGLAAYDIMTERYEITSQVMRALVNAPQVFGTLTSGTPENAAIRARSVHHVSKVVAGVPLRRPTWFFDIEEYGDALADVGTHVVDLVQWTAFPDKILNPKFVKINGANVHPLKLTAEQFQKTTGTTIPETLQKHVKNGVFEYNCNNAIRYYMNGTHVNLQILWAWEAKRGGDLYEAEFRGTRARIEIRQEPGQDPEVSVYPNEDAEDALPAVRRALTQWRGIEVRESSNRIVIQIPQNYRVGHEAHFAEVVRHFLQYVKSPKSLPAWEESGMLVKYKISTKGGK